jgi:hypothetical protein
MTHPSHTRSSLLGAFGDDLFTSHLAQTLSYVRNARWWRMTPRHNIYQGPIDESCGRYLGSNTVAADIQHSRCRIILRGADVGDTMRCWVFLDFGFCFSQVQLQLAHTMSRVRGEAAQTVNRRKGLAHMHPRLPHMTGSGGGNLHWNHQNVPKRLRRWIGR